MNKTWINCVVRKGGPYNEERELMAINIKAEPFIITHDNLDVFCAIHKSFKDSEVGINVDCFEYVVTEQSTGYTIGVGGTKAGAKRNARENIFKRTPRKIKSLIKEIAVF